MATAIHTKTFYVREIMAEIRLIDSVTVDIFDDETFCVLSDVTSTHIGVNQSGLFIALLQLRVIAIQYAVRYILYNKKA